MLQCPSVVVESNTLSVPNRLNPRPLETASHSAARPHTTGCLFPHLYKCGNGSGGGLRVV